MRSPKRVRNSHSTSNPATSESFLVGFMGVDATYTVQTERRKYTYYISRRANRPQPAFLSDVQLSAARTRLSPPGCVGRLTGRDGRVTPGACRSGSLLDGGGSGLFLLDFNQQKSWSNLRNLKT